MKTRLDDLIATAEKQAAAKAWDAAIDTYRTALGEPGAAEAGVEARLEAACRERDAARGIVRSAEPAPPQELPEAPRQEAPAQPESAPPPAPAAAWTFRTIEPPAFHLMEDSPSRLEVSGRDDPEPEPERLSILGILDPVPRPPEPVKPDYVRMMLTVLIILIVCGVIFFAANR